MAKPGVVVSESGGDQNGTPMVAPSVYPKVPVNCDDQKLPEYIKLAFNFVHEVATQYKQPIVINDSEGMGLVEREAPAAIESTLGVACMAISKFLADKAGLPVKVCEVFHPEATDGDGEKQPATPR